MLSAEFDVYDIREIEDIDEFPIAQDAKYEMPRNGLGGIGDFFGKVLDIGTTVAKNYVGLTQPQQQAPQPMQAPPQYVVAPSPQQIAIQQAQQPLMNMPWTQMPYRREPQKSFFEENAIPIVAMGGLAVLLVIVVARR